MFKTQERVTGYPGLTPDLMIPLKGSFSFETEGQFFKYNEPVIFNHIKDKVYLHTSLLESFVIVQFQSRGISSLLNFTSLGAAEIMKANICHPSYVFGNEFDSMKASLSNKEPQQIADTLDEFFMQKMSSLSTGFLSEMIDELPVSTGLQDIRSITKYSYSSVERYFKKETGMSPKKYLSLRRFKLAFEEFCTTSNDDWIYFVNKYNYYDQSHFIKEIKKYAGLTPSQLLSSSAFIKYRPIN